MLVYKKPERVFLFGGGSVMAAFQDWLEGQGFTVWSFTAPRQATDVTKAAVVDNINDYAPSVQPTDLGICFGPAWKFGTEIRAAFGNRLIDFMSIPYPSYLGGAHISWARMMGETQWGCCMQLVTENTVQGECHDGDVIFDAYLDFNESALEGQYLSFLEGFMHLVSREYQFNPRPTDQTKRFHLPRLNTQEQGWVDWSWNGPQIVKFIHAFDAPYPLARTTISDRTVTLDCAQLVEHGSDHIQPFMAGLILRVPAPGIALVACVGGFVGAHVHCDGQRADWIKPGMRLYTPRAKLEAAMTYVPNYTATGDANAR